jgi:predicted ATPase
MVIEQNGFAPSPRTFARAVAERTGGNPLFVREILRHLARAGLLGQGRPWPGPRAIAEAGLPETIRAAVTRTLRHLEPTARSLLGAATVAGVEFAWRGAARIAETDDDDALRAIEAADRLGIIAAVDDRGERYRFADPLLREALGLSLNPTRRARLRERLGLDAADPSRRENRN